MSQHKFRGQVEITWLGQAGYIFRSSSGQTVMVDPYLSDACERQFGFRRQMASPVRPDAWEADWLLCTHDHLDHQDPDMVPQIIAQANLHLAGPQSCVDQWRSQGIDADRIVALSAGMTVTLSGESELAVVRADHGTLAPDAVGLVLRIGGVGIYLAGDTCYRPEWLPGVRDLAPAVAILPINGRYGNLDEREAALVARDLKVAIVIPCHYGMFAEHNGDVLRFLKLCSKEAPQVTPVVLTAGEPRQLSSDLERRLPGA